MQAISDLNVNGYRGGGDISAETKVLGLYKILTLS